MLFSFLCDLSTQDSMLFFLACNMRYPLCYHTFTLPYQPCENILFVWMTMFQVVALKRCKGVPSIMGRRYLINCWRARKKLSPAQWITIKHGGRMVLSQIHICDIWQGMETNSWCYIGFVWTSAGVENNCLYTYQVILFVINLGQIQRWIRKGLSPSCRWEFYGIPLQIWG